MKRSIQCPKCHSRRIGHLAQQADSEDTRIRKGVVTRDLGVRPLGYACTPIETDGSNESFVVIGELEAYVCTECGYFESYVKDPGTIDWRQLKGFTWVDLDRRGEGGGPFR